MLDAKNGSVNTDSTDDIAAKWTALEGLYFPTTEASARQYGSSKKDKDSVDSGNNLWIAEDTVDCVEDSAMMKTS